MGKSVASTGRRGEPRTAAVRGRAVAPAAARGKGSEPAPALAEREETVPAAATSAPADDLRLDPANACVFRGTQALALTPKAFSVLRHLVENAGRLITKDELLETLWADTYVGDAALKVTILEIRKALGDDHRAPRFIATVHRRGYRFLGGITLVPPTPRTSVSVAPRPTPAADEARSVLASQSLVTPHEPPPPRSSPAAQHRAAPVGRPEVGERLAALLADARAGERRVAFLTGEAGSGKSAVLDAFLASFASDDATLIARAQCRESFGSTEAHAPLLEALAALCRGAAGTRVVELLRHRAPTWLAQMPWLVERAEREALQRETAGAGAGRMQRELVEALEALSAAATVVLALDDLQSSDPATLDVLAALGIRKSPARLLIVGACRPCNVALGESAACALSSALALRRAGEEIALRALSEDEVAELVARRLAPATPPARLVTLVHRRSAGNPSFAIELLDDMLRGGLLVRDGDALVLRASESTLSRRVPETLRAAIERRCERLPFEDQRLLAAASVAGDEFGAAELAAALGADAAALEERCARLAGRDGLLAASGGATAADGVAARWRFRHELVRDVLRERVTPLRRADLERRLAAAREWHEAGGPEVRVQRARCTGRLHLVRAPGATDVPRRLDVWSGRRAAR